MNKESQCLLLKRTFSIENEGSCVRLNVAEDAVERAENITRNKCLQAHIDSCPNLKDKQFCYDAITPCNPSACKYITKYVELINI